MPGNTIICPRFDIVVENVDVICGGCFYYKGGLCKYHRPKFKKDMTKRLGDIVQDVLG